MNLIDSDDLIEAISSKDLPNAVRYTKRKLAFIICPDPYEIDSTPLKRLQYGMRCATDSGRRGEAPILCYSFKLGLYGFNQWHLQAGPFSKQQLFDMTVTQMIKTNFVIVYGDEYTDSMNNLLNVAKLTVNRIDYRTI